MSAADIRRAAYVETAPLLYRKSVAAALAGAGSPRQAIKAKCLACTNFDRSEIEHCTVITCPLHAFRPYTGALVRPWQAASAEPVSLGERGAADNCADEGRSAAVRAGGGE